MDNRKLGKVILICILIGWIGLAIFDYEPKPQEGDINNVVYNWDELTSFSYNSNLYLLTRTLKNGNGVFSGCFSVNNYNHHKLFNKEFKFEYACVAWDSNKINPPILEWGFDESYYIFKSDNGLTEKKTAPPLYFYNDSHILYSIEVFFSNLPREKIIETMIK